MSSRRDPITIAPMTDRIDPEDARIRRALERLEAAIGSRPGFGRSRQTSVTTLAEGLRCRTEEHGFAIDTDLAAALGGHGTAMTPSMLLRAALGSCLAMSYRLRAARHGVGLDRIRVVVETDSAIAGMLRTDAEAPAGFTGIRYTVEIESDAPSERIEAIVDEADRLSPVLDALCGINRPVRTLAVSGGGS